MRTVRQGDPRYSESTATVHNGRPASHPRRRRSFPISQELGSENSEEAREVLYFISRRIKRQKPKNSVELLQKYSKPSTKDACYLMGGQIHSMIYVWPRAPASNSFPATTVSLLPRWNQGQVESLQPARDTWRLVPQAAKNQCPQKGIQREVPPTPLAKEGGGGKRGQTLSRDVLFLSSFPKPQEGINTVLFFS